MALLSIRAQRRRVKSSVLSQAEELALVQNAVAGDRRAQERLLEAFEPMMRAYVAWGLRFAGSMGHSSGVLDLEDLKQELRLVFLQQLPSFEHRGLRLSTFMRAPFKGSVRAHVSALTGPTRLLTNTDDKRVMLARGRIAKADRTMKASNDPETVAREAGVPVEKAVRVLQQITARHESLDLAKTSEGYFAERENDLHADRVLYETAGHLFEDEQASLQHEALMRVVLKTLPSLDARSRWILEARLGLHGAVMEFGDIGARWNFTKERARQIYMKGIAHLRSAMA